MSNEQTKRGSWENFLLQAAREISLSEAQYETIDKRYSVLQDILSASSNPLLAESHISIHTWPECGFAAVDIFMCGAARPQLALGAIKDALQAPHCQLQSVRRAPPGQA